MSNFAIGDDLPKVDVPITTKLVVAGALASQDFQDIHHDKSAAQAAGSPDIFMNILTTNGLVGRYLTDWAGKDARLKNVTFSLGAPNYPGDTMSFSGEVIAVEGDDVTVDFKGKNAMGYHVTGTAIVSVGGAK